MKKTIFITSTTKTPYLSRYLDKVSDEEIFSQCIKEGMNQNYQNCNLNAKCFGKSLDHEIP